MESVKNNTDAVESRGNGQGEWFETNCEELFDEKVPDESVENDDDTELLGMEEMEIETGFECEHYGVAECIELRSVMKLLLTNL